MSVLVGKGGRHFENGMVIDFRLFAVFPQQPDQSLQVVQASPGQKDLAQLLENSGGCTLITDIHLASWEWLSQLEHKVLQSSSTSKLLVQ